MPIIYSRRILIKSDLNLKQEREKRKLSVRELAKRIKMNYAHLHKIERGLNASEETYNKIKNFFDSGKEIS